MRFISAIFVAICGGMGVTVGAHRLWAHRSFKATNAFHWIVMLCYSVNFQVLFQICYAKGFSLKCLFTGRHFNMGQYSSYPS